MDVTKRNLTTDGVCQAGLSSSWLDPKSLSWGGSVQLSHKLKVWAWLRFGLEMIWYIQTDLSLGSHESGIYELARAQARKEVDILFAVIFTFDKVYQARLSSSWLEPKSQGSATNLNCKPGTAEDYK